MIQSRSMHISLLWPPQQLMVETLFRHYVELVEVAGYLAHSKYSKLYQLSIEVHDCIVSTYSPARLAAVAINSDIVAFSVNPYNASDAIKTAAFLKSVNQHVHVVAYGSFCCYGADQLAVHDIFDYVVATGEWELGLEIVLYLCGFISLSDLHPLLRTEQNIFTFNNGVIRLMDGIRLHPSEWGLPDYNSFPVKDYLRVGDGTVNLRVARGCPHKCAFCDEIYIGGASFRYRPVSRVIQFLTDCPDNAKVAYLNASAFTADKNWVIELCSEIKKMKINLPWRVCTRIDMVDQKLIKEMASAGCRKISFGIESLEVATKAWTGKTIHPHMIKEIASWCKEVGVTPRALLILGLPNQTSKGIKEAHQFFIDIGMETRYRSLLQVDQFVKDVGNSSGLRNSLDRWSTSVHVEGMSTMEVRALEYNL